MGCIHRLPTVNVHPMTPLLRKPLVMAAIVSIAVLAAWVIFEQFFRTSTVPFHGEASGEPPVFIDRTADFDITAPHRQGDEHLTGLDESLGSGVCAFDHDGDGWTDLFLVNGTGDTRFYGRRHWWQEARGHRLLHNVDGQRFTDITAEAGITLVSHGMGCVTADFDNDGHVDILVTSIGANALLHNLGNGRFEDVSAASGLDGTGWHTAAAVGDVDGDGKLDLYIGGFIAFEERTHL